MENISKDLLPYDVITILPPRISTIVDDMKQDIPIMDLKTKIQATIDVPYVKYVIWKDRTKDGLEISIGWNNTIRKRFVVCPPGYKLCDALDSQIITFLKATRDNCKKLFVAWYKEAQKISKARRSAKLTHDPRTSEV